ncbi:phage tail terminator-like protein [Devosia sp. MC1541]|uniref:phage tail terminator-like protein n=1 Tax=Devosia sp. MC1541 TaxID=2725264 RepID=UPI00145DB498|nr:phage tail terminator-like protein [Devosia sp. MC1541]
MSIPSIETRIFEAIRTRVSSLPMAVTYEIIWTEGAELTLEPSKRYLRCTWTPNATQRIAINSAGQHRRPGVLQIDVIALKSQAASVAREVAGQVAAHFPADLSLEFMGVRARVTAAPSVFSPFIGTHVQVPVSILIEAFA